MPAPRRHYRKGAEGLQARDVCAKGKVSISNLEWSQLIAGIASDIEALDNLAPLYGFRLDKRQYQQGEE